VGIIISSTEISGQVTNKISIKRINIKTYDVAKREQLLKEVHEVLGQIFEISIGHKN
jgi:hypothetical protein